MLPYDSSDTHDHLVVELSTMRGKPNNVVRSWEGITYGINIMVHYSR
jgi:hypothetical protein